jgi:hypothetical protein
LRARQASACCLPDSSLACPDAEELSSGEEDEEGSEDEPAPASAPKKQQQQAQPAKKQQQAGAKRLAGEQPAAKTPQPAKKARAEQQAAPATAPAKVAAAKQGAAASGMATPSNEKEYLEAVKAALQAAGQPIKLAAVSGSQEGEGGLYAHASTSRLAPAADGLSPRVCVMLTRRPPASCSWAPR